MDRISLFEPYFGKDDFVGLVETLNSIYWKSDLRVREFEEKFSAFIKRKYVYATDTWSNTLLLTLRALGAKNGDEAIVSPLHLNTSFITQIIEVGIRPIFVDVERWTFSMDINKIERSITKNTKFVIVTNPLGFPAEWKFYQDLRYKYNIKIIEDCTEGIGSLYYKNPIGSFGDVSIFDFDFNKVLTTGKGGALATDDDTIYNNILSLTEKLRIYDVRMSNLNAALGITQLNKIRENLEIRKNIVKKYDSLIGYMEGVKGAILGKDNCEIYYNFYVVHLAKRYGFAETQQMIESLQFEGIEASHYAIPSHLRPDIASKYGYKRGDFHIAEEIGQRGILLPLNTQLTEDDIKFIGEKVKDSIVTIGAGSRDL